MSQPVTAGEAARVDAWLASEAHDEAIAASGLLDAPRRAAFDRLTALAARMAGVPVSLITVVERRRQFFVSSHGLAEPWASRRETPLSHSFCKYVVTSDTPLAISNAREHQLVCDNLAVPELGVVAYLGHPIRGGDGRVLGSFALIDSKPRAWTDEDRWIAQQFAALAMREIALAHATLLSAAVLERSSDAFLSFDANGRVTNLNPAAERLLDCRLASARCQSIETLVRTTRSDAARVAFERALAGETVEADDEVELVTQDRHVRWVELRAYPSPEGVTLVIRDVTDRHRAEARLRESEAQFRSLFDANPNAVLEVDVTGRVADANAAAAALTGYSLDEVRGRPFVDFLVPEQRAIARARFAEALEGRPLRWEHAVVDRSGARLVLRGASVPMLVGGRVVGVYAIAEDVTPDRQLEAQMRAAQRMEAVGRLAGGIAHDFNNLLTAIRGYAELIAAGAAAGSPLAADATEIVRAASRAGELTRQLLTFSRRDVSQPRLVSVAETIRTMARILQRAVGEDITLGVRVAADPAPVTIDPAQLEQVVMNLVMNARDAMPGGGALTIALDEAPPQELRLPWEVRPGRYWRLRITDTGGGFTPEAQAHLFEPFFTTKQAGKGTGLGLAMVYGIVKRAGGHVLIDGQAGQGTTVRLYLPDASAHSAEAEEATPVAAPPAPRAQEAGATVLLAEDDDAVRALATDILRRAGFTVLAARHGRQALELAAAHPGEIHALLSDVVMPGINGPTLADALLHTRPDVRVLFMSGYAGDDVARRGIESTGAPVLAKPFTAAELVDAVHAALVRA